MDLQKTNQVLVVQRREWAELFGFETRNKYEIFDQSQQRIGFAAEQQKGLLGLLFRQLLGHWRSFEVHFFDEQKQQVMVSRHPFRFFFQEFHIFDRQNRQIGRCEQRFGIFTKKFNGFDNYRRRCPDCFGHHLVCRDALFSERRRNRSRY